MSALPVDPHLYSTFLGVMVVMAITPGPANLFAVATGVEKGRASALVGVVGMNCATLVWFAAAALGLGALVKALRGAWRDAAPADPQQPDHAVAVRKGRSAFVDGFAVQIANPKAILFFTAVLPPFLDVERPVAPQLALFALAVIGMDMMSMSAYALSGAALSQRMQQPRFRRGFGLFVGVLLLTAAVLIVLRL